MKPSKWRKVYVVARNARDARTLAEAIRHPTLRQANEHLRELRTTDKGLPLIYRVYTVKLPAGSTARSTG